MKKISIIVLVGILFLALSLPAFANSTQTNIEYFEDGSYVVTEIKESRSGFSPFAISTKSGSKTVTAYSASGSRIASLTVNGTFNYNGTVARSTAASYTKTIYDSTWSFVSGSSSYSANYATATGTFRNVTTKTVSVTLYCDQDGNLS